MEYSPTVSTIDRIAFIGQLSGACQFGGRVAACSSTPSPGSSVAPKRLEMN